MNKIIALLLITIFISYVSSLQKNVQIQGAWDIDHGVNAINGGDYGSFYGYVDERQNGKFVINVSFNRTRIDEKYSQDLQSSLFRYEGSFYYELRREEGRSGNITSEEFTPRIVERIRQQH